MNPWQEFVEEAKTAFSNAEKAFNPDLVKIGDVVEFWVSRYQHSAHVQITKINNKTWKGVERKGSYGAGRKWIVYKNTPGLTMDRSWNLKEAAERLEASGFKFGFETKSATEATVPSSGA